MIIENCPSCGSKLVYIKDQLFCKNSANCPAQNSKAVEHFCKVVKIKGLGPKRIEALELASIQELYDLTEEIIADKLGNKVAATLMAEIDKARKLEFATFLTGCGIPLLGSSVAAKLAAHVNSFEEINTTTCNKAGLGPKVKDNLLNWIKRGFILPDGIEFTNKQPVKQEEQKTDCVTVCISGKISKYTKAQAEVLLNQAGFDVKSTITKDVQILITESTVSSKFLQAQKIGLPIGTLEEVLNGTVQPTIFKIPY